MGNGIKVTDRDSYKKGDTIELTTADYWYGLWLGTEFVLNLPLNKPIDATGCTVTLSGSMNVGTVNGLASVSGKSVTSVTLAKTSIEISVTGTPNITIPSFTPVATGLTATVTFT